MLQCHVLKTWKQAQLPRVSSDVAAHIVTGLGCGSRAECMRMLVAAQGSAAILEYFLLLAGLIKARDWPSLDVSARELRRLIAEPVEELRAPH